MTLVCNDFIFQHLVFASVTLLSSKKGGEGSFLCNLGTQEDSSQDRLSSRDLPMSPVVGNLSTGSPTHLNTEAVGFVSITFGCCTVCVPALDFDTSLQKLCVPIDCKKQL